MNSSEFLVSSFSFDVGRELGSDGNHPKASALFAETAAVKLNKPSLLFAARRPRQ
jgi:hypothetical protein